MDHTKGWKKGGRLAIALPRQCQQGEPALNLLGLEV